MDDFTALKISVMATIAACEQNSTAPDDDAFMRGFAAAHRKLGAFLQGAIDRVEMRPDSPCELE